MIGIKNGLIFFLNIFLVRVCCKCTSYINVVLFLADYDLHDECFTQEIPSLHIPLIAKLKPCCPDNVDSSCECVKLLDENIDSLECMARKKFGIITGLIFKTNLNTVKYQSKSYSPNMNEKSTCANCEMKSDAEPDDKGVVVAQTTHNEFAPNNQMTAMLVPIQWIPTSNWESTTRSTPTFDLPNNIYKRRRRNYRVLPRDSQYLKFESNNLKSNNRYLNSPDLRDTGKKSPINMEFLKLFDDLRNSLFNGLVDPALDKRQKERDKEIGIQLTPFELVQQISLYKLVEETLRSLKQRANKRKTGFILFVKGGKLSEINNSCSDLIQSIKHVKESSCDKTLIIITGKISSSPDSDKSCWKAIPVYAIGPDSDCLANARAIADIPNKIKKIIEKNYNNS